MTDFDLEPEYLSQRRENNAKFSIGLASGSLFAAAGATLLAEALLGRNADLLDLGVGGLVVGIFVLFVIFIFVAPMAVKVSVDETGITFFLWPSGQKRCLWSDSRFGVAVVARENRKAESVDTEFRLWTGALSGFGTGLPIATNISEEAFAEILSVAKAHGLQIGEKIAPGRVPGRMYSISRHPS
jgi:hypothetical protein